MTLEKQVTSLELSKRLKELGVKQESFAFWHEATNGTVTLINRDRWLPAILADIYSAFTVAELGEMLPQNYGTRYDGQGWSVYDGNGKYVVGMSTDTEADARAKMSIYLIENNFLTLQ